MLFAIFASLAPPVPLPVSIVLTAPDSVWTVASALGSIFVALVTAILAFATIVLALQTRKMVVEARESILLANRTQQLSFTDKEILHMIEPEVRDALNLILHGSSNQEHREYAKTMFAIGYKVPVRERPEPQQSYFKAVGLYDNLFDRISSYSEAGLIDEHLFFSQYDELIIGLYFLLCDYVWEGNEFAPRTRITKFATRALLHYSEHAEVPWLGDDQFEFYEGLARQYYPGPKTDRLISRLRETRSRVWYKTYSQPSPGRTT